MYNVRNYICKDAYTCTCTCIHTVDVCLYMYTVHTVDLYNVLMYMCYNNNVCDNYYYTPFYTQ